MSGVCSGGADGRAGLGASGESGLLHINTKIENILTTVSPNASDAKLQTAADLTPHNFAQSSNKLASLRSKTVKAKVQRHNTDH